MIVRQEQFFLVITWRIRQDLGCVVANHPLSYLWGGNLETTFHSLNQEGRIL